VTSGWFVFSVVACIIICTGCVLAVAMLKAAWAQREREALTSADLRALEESAVYLIDQLRTETESAIGDLESKCAALKGLIDAADQRISALRELSERCAALSELQPVSQGVPQVEADSKRQQVLALASSGMGCAEIARKAGMDCAEVKLMLRLAGMAMN